MAMETIFPLMELFALCQHNFELIVNLVLSLRPFGTRLANCDNLDIRHQPGKFLGDVKG